MRAVLSALGVCAVSIIASGCISSPRFTMASSSPDESASMVTEEGIASYYADEFNGRKTSNGEVYDMHALTAAHRTLPFNSKVRVTNTLTGKSIIVRINDRGPFKDNRIIDLSLAGAKSLDLIRNGTAPVRLEVLEPGDSAGMKK